MWLHANYYLILRWELFDLSVSGSRDHCLLRPLLKYLSMWKVFQYINKTNYDLFLHLVAHVLKAFETLKAFYPLSGNRTHSLLVTDVQRMLQLFSRTATCGANVTISYVILIWVWYDVTIFMAFYIRHADLWRRSSSSRTPRISFHHLLDNHCCILPPLHSRIYHNYPHSDTGIHTEPRRRCDLFPYTPNDTSSAWDRWLRTL